MRYGTQNTIRSFGGQSFRDFSENFGGQIYAEIEGKGKVYILGVDETEFKNYLKDEYRLEPLSVIVGSEEILEPKKIKMQKTDFRGSTYQADALECKVRYQFAGSASLFEFRPSQFIMTGHDIEVDKHRQTVSFSFNIDKQDPDLFRRMKNEAFGNAFANLENINSEVIQWNSMVSGLVEGSFKKIKDKLIGENSFFEAIKVNVDPRTKSVFTVPVIQKKILPVPAAGKKQFSSEPTFSSETYQDALTVLYDFTRSMERKPSTYLGKDEEAIRDLLITILETRYQGVTATGETFNKNGKTDILLKHQDGSNLFVGECKFWHGEKEMIEDINQLFDRYLTWRDSKTALLYFVRNKEISKVTAKIKEHAQRHPYFKNFVESKAEGRYSFIFHLPGDKGKDVYLEIMAFHFVSIK